MTYSAYGLRGFDDYYVDDNKDVRSRMKEIHSETASITQDRWLQQSMDSRVYAGDPSACGEIYGSNSSFSRGKRFSFNKTKRIVNAVSGYQRRNRKTLNVLPIEGADQKTSEQLSKTLMWQNSQMNTFNTYSEGFLGSLITGMNLLSFWVDYNMDPFSGDLHMDNLGYNSYIIDPYFKKKDLTDCQYVWTRKFIGKQQAAALLPKRKEEIMAMTPYAFKDEYFNFLPQNYNTHRVNMVTYDEFYYLDERKATVLVDVENEETIEWSGPESNLKLFLMQFPGVKKKTVNKKTVKLAICVNNIVMYDGPNQYKIDSYPFVPIMCYHQPELTSYSWSIQGMVRGLRDAQFILDRREQILLDTLESQVNSGLKVMSDALVDPSDAFKTGQGQVLFIKKTAPHGIDSVQKIPSADVSPAFMQVIEQMDKAMMDISGLNEELLGSAEDDKAGILSMLRQGAGLTTLQVIFDNADEALQNIGRLEIELIQANFTPSKIKRILNEEPSEQFYNKTFQKYDAVVAEGLDLPTQRMQAFKQAIYLKETGTEIPDEFLLEMSTLQNKTELIEQIKAQKEQQAQQAQQAQALQMKQLEAQIRLADTQSAANVGLAKERDSRVLSNEGLAVERRFEAVKDLEQAELNKIKSIKELQGINLEHVQKALEIIEALKAGEAAKVETVTQQVEQGQSA